MIKFSLVAGISTAIAASVVAVLRTDRDDQRELYRRSGSEMLADQEEPITRHKPRLIDELCVGV